MALLLSRALFGDDEAVQARDFCTPEEIQQSIKASKNYRLDGSDPAASTPLLFFDTRMQRTWLTKTDRRLYCILDDLRKPGPHINWSMAISEIAKDGKLILEIRAHDLSETGKSGMVDFGPNHRDWLYSTKLFTVRPVEEEIAAFLLK